MTAPERIKAIADFYIQLEEEQPAWAFITFANIKSTTGISKAEAQPVCELFKRKDFLNFEYMPFDDHDKAFSVFDKEKDYQDPTEAMSFLSRPNLDALREVSNATALQRSLAGELRPEVRYDPETSELISGEKRVFLGSNNSRVLAEKVFNEPYGTRFLGSDIAPLLDDMTENGKAVKAVDAGKSYLFNVVNRLNEKIEEVSGVPKLIQCKQDKIWIK